MRILVTGGSGYIGSHTVLALISNGYKVTVIDNLSNSSQIPINRIECLLNTNIDFINCDLRSSKDLCKVFSQFKFDSVIHFASLKAVGESVIQPLRYYENNVYGTLNLLKVMEKYDVRNLIFSSSATVYGKEAKVPYKEGYKLGTPSSPYGSSKVMIERILQDQVLANKNFKIVSLRYFNPIGAHKSGKIGEDPKGTPNNLLPFITQVAIGKRKKLKVFGNDYDTKDGTCQRDYLHVMDLADGHVKAIQWLDKNIQNNNVEIFNLGTGKPVSVLEIINTFKEVTGVSIDYEFAPRRSGDLDSFWADTTKANNLLSWKTKFDLNQMISDSWNWQIKNPNGY